MDLPGLIIHAVAAHDERVVSRAEDLDLAADLTADGVLVVAVDHLERVVAAGAAVADHPDDTAVAAADPTHSLELRLGRSLRRKRGR